MKARKLRVRHGYRIRNVDSLTLSLKTLLKNVVGDESMAKNRRRWQWRRRLNDFESALVEYVDAKETDLISDVGLKKAYGIV